MTFVNRNKRNKLDNTESRLFSTISSSYYNNPSVKEEDNLFQRKLSKIKSARDCIS